VVRMAWHARGQGFKSPQLHQPQRSFRLPLRAACEQARALLWPCSQNLGGLPDTRPERGTAPARLLRAAKERGLANSLSTTLGSQADLPAVSPQLPEPEGC
jgi:hypothetical protein